MNNSRRCDRDLMSALLTVFVVTTAFGCSEDAQSESVDQDGDWVVLFDGETVNGWKGYRQTQVPDSWRVEDGTLHFAPTGERGDILTVDQYANFVLELEWRVSSGGNSGIMFRVSEDHDRTYETGPEMQVLDNDGHADGRNPLTSAGSNYGLHAPVEDATRPVGSWNAVRIVVNGDRVEHWLNERLVVEYNLWTDDWKARVASTKFEEWPRYGMNTSGHVVLQDHGDPVWYRNIRIRNLGTS